MSSVEAANGYAGLMPRFSCRTWRAGQAATFACWNYRNAEPYEAHDHDYHELFWVTGGVGVHWVGGHARSMETGYLVLVRPEDRHAFSGAGAGVEFFNFAFRSGLWRQLRRRQPRLAGRYFDCPAIGAREFWLGAAALERLRLLAADLAAGHYDGLTAEVFLGGVVGLLENWSGEAGGPPGTPRWLAEAIHRLRRYPEFTGGVPRLVRLAGRSHEHTARACRRHLGRAPREIVAEARLNWAAAQIAATDKKILEIALECGFENLGHFYQCFRRRHGMTPCGYRQRFQARQVHLA